jgi:hypothetical protein
MAFTDTPNWQLPTTADECFARYRGKVRMFAARFDDTEDVVQNFWLKMYSPVGRNAWRQDAVNGYDLIYKPLVAHPECCERMFLAYLKTAVMSASYRSEADALNHGLSIDSGDDGIEYNDSFIDWVEDRRNTQYAGMKNDPVRVIYLQEFLAFVESRDTDLLPFIEQIELAQLRDGTTGVGKRIGLSPKESTAMAGRLFTLATEFEGVEYDGRKQFHIRQGHLSPIRTVVRKMRVAPPTPAKDDLMLVLSEKTFVQAAEVYQIDFMVVRKWALDYGFTRRGGKIRILPVEWVRGNRLRIG